MNQKDTWADLSAEMHRFFEAHSQTLNLKRGEYIYKQGDSPRGLYFVVSGLVGLTILSAQGKEHLLRFFRQGQFFGHRALFSQEGYHGNTMALEATVLKFVPQNIVREGLDKDTSLLKDVVQVLAKELRQSEIQHVMILENQIKSRVAQSIIYLKDLHPQHNWTRQEIANFCASTVSTVIKALAELENEGLISQEGRSITILNRDKLIALQDQ